MRSHLFAQLEGRVLGGTHRRDTTRGDDTLDEHDGGEGGGFGNGGVEARCRVEIRRMRLAGESNPWLIVTTVQ